MKIKPVESSFSNYFFTVDYVASAVVLYFIRFVHLITITFNFKRCFGSYVILRTSGTAN